MRLNSLYSIVFVFESRGKATYQLLFDRQLSLYSPDRSRHRRAAEEVELSRRANGFHFR